MGKRSIDLSQESIDIIDEVKGDKIVSTSTVVNEIIMSHFKQQNLLKKIEFNLNEINKNLGIENIILDDDHQLYFKDENKKISGFKINQKTKELIKINADKLGINNSQFIEKIVNDYSNNKDYKLAITKIEAQVHILTTVISEIEVENFKTKVKNYNAKRFGKYKGW